MPSSSKNVYPPARLSEAELAALTVEASLPITPAERLHELSLWHACAPLRHAITANPNTATHTLLDLAALCRDIPTADAYLDALFANPVAPLLLLEAPDFVDCLNRRTLLRMLRHGETPAAFLRVLANHSNSTIASPAARHIVVAGELDPDGAEWEDDTLAELSGLKRGDPEPFRVLARRGIAPEWLLQRLKPKPVEFGAPEIKGNKFEMVGPMQTTLRRFLRFTHERLARDEMKRGGDSENTLFRLGVALNPGTTAVLRTTLAADGDRYVRAAARARIRYPHRTFRL